MEDKLRYQWSKFNKVYLKSMIQFYAIGGNHVLRYIGN